MLGYSLHQKFLKLKFFNVDFFQKTRFLDLKFWSQLLIIFFVLRDYPKRFQHPQISCCVSIRFWKYCNPEAVNPIFCQKWPFYCTFFEKKSKNRFSSFWVRSGWKFICSNKGLIVKGPIFYSSWNACIAILLWNEFLKFSKNHVFWPHRSEVMSDLKSDLTSEFSTKFWTFLCFLE